MKIDLEKAELQTHTQTHAAQTTQKPNTLTNNETKHIYIYIESCTHMQTKQHTNNTNTQQQIHTNTQTTKTCINTPKIQTQTTDHTL